VEELMFTGLLLLLALAAPFAVPALGAVAVTRFVRRRRERIEARKKVGQLCE
jgi:hypothetical protein